MNNFLCKNYLLFAGTFTGKNGSMP